MMYGVGTDLVEVARIEGILKKWCERFTLKVFSDGEIRYCSAKSCPARHLAARFAAKEAFLKGLGLGMGRGVGFRDVEVINSPEGKPELVLHERAKNMIESAGIRENHLSISHTERYAMAVVALET
jgi:holo-[acyl-carrier protein] synthase